MKNMQMFCTAYKPTKVYWVEKQKLFVSGFSSKGTERSSVCVCVCARSSIYVNMRIKAAGWDGSGSDEEAMGRLKSSWRSIEPSSSSSSSLPHGVFIRRLSSMQSSRARCYKLSSGGAFQSLWDPQCGDECQWSLWWLPESVASWRGWGLLQIC